LKQGIEPTQAAKATGKRDASDGQIRFGQQLFGEQKSLGLGDCNGRDSEFELDDPAKVS
jgi:hypothetical protein